MADALPPLAADDGSCRIEIFGPPVEYVYGTLWNSSYWSDNAVWGGWVGEGLGWRDVTPQSVNLQITWGTDDAQGALSIASAGSWSITTYDPERLLDPSNSTGPLVDFLTPGGFVRVKYKDEIVRHGFIDEITFDMMSLTGSIRASDGISLMANAKIPEGSQHDPTIPYTMRARARWVLTKAGVDYITVEDDPTGNDPVVGELIDRETSAWQQINAAAFDALHACWLDRLGVLRFRNFGSPRQTPVIIGGANGIPIDTLGVKVTLEGVYNHAIARREDWNNETYHEAKNQQSIDVYGDLLISRDRQNPQSSFWVDHVVADRGAFEHQYEIGTIRPQTEAQFLSLLDLGMVDEIQLRVESRGPQLVEYPRVLGGRIEANVDSGWSAGLVTYLPSRPWTPGSEANYQIRRYDCNKNRELYFTNTNQGSGGGRNQNPLHLKIRDNDPDNPTGEGTLVLLDFPAINWSDVDATSQAKLRLFAVPHDHTPDDSTRPLDYIRIYRIDATWSESTTYPGPAKTEIYTFFMEGKHIGWFEMDVGQIVRDWAPVAAGGNGLPQYGIGLLGQPDWVFPDGAHMDFSDRSVGTKPYIKHLFLKM